MIYKIGDIAKVMGVTTEAIRHYERMEDSSNRKGSADQLPILYRGAAEPAAVHTTFITDGNQFAADTGAVLNGSLHSYEQVISKL